MKKPIFFISSTIYDFYDLRSSIKYFLEEQGCQVLASEYNDFRKPLDLHSYQACLDSIHQADYFILLVGSRVGGWYDKESQISITQREYREAYKLHLDGRLKIINFIRSDIWNLRADRKELDKYLNSLDVDSDLSVKIANHPTKSATNPKFIIDFINEISRNKESKTALKGEGQLPTGNWLHVFTSFRDVIDVLKPEIFEGVPIEDAIIRRLLLSELREILRKCLIKSSEGLVYSPTFAINNFYHEHEITKDILNNDHTTVKTKQWDLLSFFAVHLLGVKLHPLILPKTLSSSTFLTFNTVKGTFEEDSVYHSLHLLQKEIQLFLQGNVTETLEIVFKHTPRNRQENMKEIEVNTMNLLSLLHLFLRWSNVITIIKAVIQYLEGGRFVMPKIFGKSPISHWNQELKNETITREELDNFISGK